MLSCNSASCCDFSRLMKKLELLINQELPILIEKGLR
jgi:hypothetical protein